MKKKITETKFIKKITSIIDISNVKNLISNNLPKKVLRDKLYYELTAIDEDGNERNGFDTEIVNVPFTDLKTCAEDRRKVYLNILNERFGVDGKIPNKKENPDAWNFVISNIDIFYPMEICEDEVVLS